MHACFSSIRMGPSLSVSLTACADKTANSFKRLWTAANAAKSGNLQEAAIGHKY